MGVFIIKELDEKSELGIKRANIEMKTKRKWPKFIMLAASAFVLFVCFYFIRDHLEQSSTNIDSFKVMEDGSIHVPTIKLPEKNDREMTNMIGLIVYNEKIYTQTRTTIEGNHATELVGEKLGTTKGNIDEWSKQSAYDVELASTIGIQDIYSVKGYDPNFRIMTYLESDGIIYTEFYECLNGITVHSGQDIFGNLNMSENVVSAIYQVFHDWYGSSDRFYPIENVELLNVFIEELNHTIPYIREDIEKELGDFRNDKEYRNVTVELMDGSKVNLVVLKQGYISYGVNSLYFKMDSDVFSEFWKALEGNET